MLIESKEPPRWASQGESVRVTLRRQEISAPFRRFVTEEGQAGRVLGIDHLLVVRYLLDHPEIDTTAAARQCQRPEEEAREVLNEMETRLGYLERGRWPGAWRVLDVALGASCAAGGRWPCGTRSAH